MTELALHNTRRLHSCMAELGAGDVHTSTCHHVCVYVQSIPVPQSVFC